MEFEPNKLEPLPVIHDLDCCFIRKGPMYTCSCQAKSDLRSNSMDQLWDDWVSTLVEHQTSVAVPQNNPPITYETILKAMKTIEQAEMDLPEKRLVFYDEVHKRVSDIIQSLLDKGLSIYDLSKLLDTHQKNVAFAWNQRNRFLPIETLKEFERTLSTEEEE